MLHDSPGTPAANGRGGVPWPVAPVHGGAPLDRLGEDKATNRAGVAIQFAHDLEGHSPHRRQSRPRGAAVTNAARIRYRMLLRRAHDWLSRHPRLRDGLQATGALTGGPETIARGVAIGLFIGLTPTVGIQTALMIAVCVLLSGNFPAAFASSFVANPVTIAPLYWGYHEIGEKMVEFLPETAGMPEAARLGGIGGIGGEILYTGLGSLLIAVPVAATAYLLTHLILTRRAG
jgi:uncharacterized protein